MMTVAARYAPLSAELTLLAACDLDSDAALADRVASASKNGLYWQRFERLAFGNEMAGLVGARLAQVAPDALPADMAERMRLALQQQSMMQIAQTAGAAALTRQFAEAGVRSIVLKGMAAAHMLYPADPAWRISCDIDLLIDHADLITSDRLLRAAGYERTWPEQLPAVGADTFDLLANVFTYLSPNTGVVIELHHRITLNPHWLPVSFVDLHAASLEIATRFGTIRGLDGPLLVQYLSLHALAHHGYRLKWFCDIARALRRASAESCGQYVGNHAPPLATYPGELVDNVLAAIGYALDQPSDGQRTMQGAAQRILADMENPVDLPSSRSLSGLWGELRFLRFLMRLSPGLRGKGVQFLLSASDPRDVDVLRLDARFAPVYAVLGPALALWRGIRR
ncbi:MAG: nucleotidyltransferase family protein [Novosphingobium sp.]